MMEIRIRKKFIKIIFRDYLLKEFITKIVLFLMISMKTNI